MPSPPIWRRLIEETAIAMEHLRPEDTDCEKQFVLSFIEKRRQPRYLEMLDRGNLEKFHYELSDRMWGHLDPNTTLHCKSGIGIDDIARVCPETLEVEWFHVMNRPPDSLSRIRMADLPTDPTLLMSGTAMVISILSGRLALYYLEGYLALCYRMAHLTGPLAECPRFCSVVDPSWR